MDASTAVAVRATYLHTFDSFATDPTAIAELPQVGNIRYAREILGLLVTNGLVVEDELNGAESVWQVANPGTYDSHTRAEAEQVIDAWLNEQGVESPEPATPTPAKAGKAKPAKPNSNPADLPYCRCGCGQNVGRKSNYKPGHDARHAGQIARSIADSGDFSLLTELPSEKLEAKAREMAERLIGKSGPPTPPVVPAKAPSKATARSTKSVESLLPDTAPVKSTGKKSAAMKKMEAAARDAAKRAATSDDDEDEFSMPAYRIFDIIIRVSIEEEQVPPEKDGEPDYRAFHQIAKDTLDVDQVYDVIEVK